MTKWTACREIYKALRGYVPAGLKIKHQKQLDLFNFYIDDIKVLEVRGVLVQQWMKTHGNS